MFNSFHVLHPFCACCHDIRRFGVRPSKGLASASCREEQPKDTCPFIMSHIFRAFLERWKYRLLRTIFDNIRRRLSDADWRSVLMRWKIPTSVQLSRHQQAASESGLPPYQISRRVETRTVSLASAVTTESVEHAGKIEIFGKLKHDPASKPGKFASNKKYLVSSLTACLILSLQ